MACERHIELFVKENGELVLIVSKVEAEIELKEAERNKNEEG